MLKKFLKIIQNSERGASGVMPLMVSTFGGALFLFTFYNLTQYTSARSAADQAARRAARCLSPTDAECREQSVSEDNQVPQNWYGYNPAQGPTTILVDNYTYTGQIFYENIGARYNSYEVQTGNPVVMHQQKAVKPVRFYGLLNSYQLLRADLTITIQNSLTGGSKLCRLREAVELPAGVQVSVSDDYNDPRWCDGHTSMAEVSTAEGCEDALNGQWQIAAGLYCRLTLPNRSPNDQPWMLLGGSPVCDGDPEAPYAEIPQTEAEVRSLANQYFGSQAVPGTTGRAISVTGKRQFVVVEVFSCNPDSFKSKLKNVIKNKEDLKKYFTSYDKRGFPGDEINPDLNGTAGESSFIYKGAPGVSYLAQQNWTYFEWTRQADGVRHLERKVCDWMTFDEVSAKYPEFRDGSVQSYESGKEFGRDVKTYTFYDAPSCLETETTQKSYTCPNKTIVGQVGSFLNCARWKEEQERLESEYKTNLTKAIELNSNQSWVEFETLPTDFKTTIEPYYSQAYVSPTWEFSWSNTEFFGQAIANPLAVRDKNGLNPKELAPANYVKSIARNDDKVDPGINDKLLRAIALQEGAPLNNAISYSAAPTGSQQVHKIKGVWPFITDQNGNAIKTVRPYVSPSVNGNGFDYNTDCTPDDSCNVGSNYNSLEELLRKNAAQVTPEVDLNDPAYKFEYTEQLVGVEFLDKTSARNYPACTQYRTMCQKDIGDGNKIALGASVVMPESCRNGTHVNCFADYQNGEIVAAKYDDALLVDKAKLKALGEVRKLIPAATLCEDLSAPNCVSVDVQQVGKEIQVAVNFAAQLTTPFKEMLGQETLEVTGRKREIIETERLKD